VSLIRWVFKWCLKVIMFSHSRMSAGREFQVDGAAKENAQWPGPVWCVCEERSALEHWKSAEPELVHRVCTSSLRYVGVAV